MTQILKGRFDGSRATHRAQHSPELLAERYTIGANGRRVLAVFAEQKRMVKGILHGESDSRRTAFIEPEETIELNNQISELENSERREVYRILK